MKSEEIINDVKNIFMNYLVTGTAGFIGMHLSKRLSSQKKNKVIGIDNLNNYYDLNLKKRRVKNLIKNKRCKFVKTDICNFSALDKIIKLNKIKIIIHLAAQPGVRHSIKKPNDYTKNNLLGFANVLEVSRKNDIQHLLFASSSSVYGKKNKKPFKEVDNTDFPLNYYGATKKANEIMAYSYSYLYSMRITGLRFFTVYGPWGRPDMSPYLFTYAIAKNKSITLFNNGNLYRDFTYIDDVIDAVVKITKKNNNKNFNLINIGGGKPIKVNKFLEYIRENLNNKLIIQNVVKPKSDMSYTYSNNNKLKNLFKYKPKISLKDGVKKYVDWFKKYYL